MFLRKASNPPDCHWQPSDNRWLSVRHSYSVRFIWLDLNGYMQTSTWEEERRLVQIMIEHGVWIASGKSFKSEVPGWFRITFAVPEEEFDFGVKRYVIFKGSQGNSLSTDYLTLNRLKQALALAESLKGEGQVNAEAYSNIDAYLTENLSLSRKQESTEAVTEGNTKMWYFFRLPDHNKCSTLVHPDIMFFALLNRAITGDKTSCYMIGDISTIPNHTHSYR